MKLEKPVPILIIEDCEEDYEAIEEALTQAGTKNPIFHCQDGEEALAFLFHRGVYSEPEKAPRPGVILLDLNLPGTDGREVLEIVKNNQKLQTIPVIIFTTSDNETDVLECYQIGANSYIQKPVDSDGFSQAIERIKNFWFEIVIVAKERANG